jgi:hypothetical protein
LTDLFIGQLRQDGCFEGLLRSQTLILPLGDLSLRTPRAVGRGSPARRSRDGPSLFRTRHCCLSRARPAPDFQPAGRPISRTVNGNAACRRPYLRERIPQDPPGEMPGQGAPYGDLSGDTRNGLTTPLEPPGLQHPATPPLLKSVDEAQSGGPNGISPGLDLHVATPWTV